MIKSLRKLISEIENLPVTEQERIAQIMLKILETSPQKRPPLFGSDKDIISISDDFDEPLADFEEYE